MTNIIIKRFFYKSFDAKLNLDCWLNLESTKRHMHVDGSGRNNWRGSMFPQSGQSILPGAKFEEIPGGKLRLACCICIYSVIVMVALILH